jgi:hypothetical protein
VKKLAKAPTPLKTPGGARTLACCIETRLVVRPTPRRVSAQHAGVRAPQGVFITFGEPQAHGNSLTVALPSRERKRPVAGLGTK